MIEPHLGSSSGELSHRFCMLTRDAAHTARWLAQPPPARRADKPPRCFSAAYSAYLSKDCINQLNMSAESVFSSIPRRKPHRGAPPRIFSQGSRVVERCLPGEGFAWLRCPVPMFWGCSLVSGALAPGTPDPDAQTTPRFSPNCLSCQNRFLTSSLLIDPVFIFAGTPCMSKKNR